MKFLSYFQEELQHGFGGVDPSSTRARKVSRRSFMPLFNVLLLLAAGCMCVRTVAAQTAYFGQQLGGGGSFPAGVAVDGNGSVYVADATGDKVYEMSAGCVSSSCVTALGGGFSSPQGVAVDLNGNIYIADSSSNAVKEMPAGCASSSCVTALGGGFSNPTGVAVDTNGKVYVADYLDNAVKVMPAGCASASCVSKLGGGFSMPWGVAVDGSGHVYVGQETSDAVMEIPPGCTSASCVSTLGGGFSEPLGVAVDTNGNVYVADYSNGAAKEIPPGCGSSSCVTTLAVGFFDPEGVAVDGNGNVYVADTGNFEVKEIIRHVVYSGSLAVNPAAPENTTVTFIFAGGGKISAPAVLTQGAAGLDFTDAGTGTCTTNGTGHVYAAGDTCTVNVAFKPRFTGARNGAVVLSNSAKAPIAVGYIYGYGNGPQAVFSPVTPAKVALYGLPPGSSFQAVPYGVAVDESGDVYVADDYNGMVTKTPPGCASYTCVTEVGGQFAGPYGVALDAGGNIYVADAGGNTIKEMPSGCASSACVKVLGNGFDEPWGVAVDGSGNIYVADWDNNKVKEMPPGCATSSCVAVLGGGFNGPTGVAVDVYGNVYVADYNNSAVKKMPAGCATSSCVITLGGGFKNPTGVAVDGMGDIFVADAGNKAVKEMTTFCGSPSCVTTLFGDLNSPFAVAVNGMGTVFISDSGTKTLWELGRATPPWLTFASTVPGQTSSDSPQTVTVYNIGNEMLTIDGLSYPNDFPEASRVASDCTATSMLETGSSCTLSIDFSPLAASVTGPSTPLSEQVSLSDDNLNGSSVVQSVGVSGTETVVPPELTAPAPGSKLTGSSAMFTWTVGAGNKFYQLRIGNTGVGSQNLYASGVLTGTTASVTGLPTNGGELFVRLYYEDGPVWSSIDYTCIEAGTAVPPAMTSPTPGSVLTGSSANFEWSAGSGVTAYQLRIGNTGAGSSNLFASGVITAASANVTGLPTIGATLNVRLYYEIDAVWHAIDYLYSESGTFAVPALTSPTPGSKLTGSSAAFSWTTGSEVTMYQLRIGNTGVGSSNLYASGALPGTTANVTGLPTNGGELFVRLYYESNNVWKSIDYTYVESGTATPPALTSPTPGSVLTGSSADFGWTAGAGITAYQLRIGTTGVGSQNLYASGVTALLEENVTGLPTTGATLYVRLYYEVAAVWHSIDYLYSEFGTPAPPALTAPTPGSTLTGSSAVFSWTAGSENTEYQLRIGSTGVGSSNLFASGALLTTSANVTGLPTSGGELFVRLYYLTNNVWKPIDYTYVESGTAVAPVLNSPPPGSTLAGSTVEFGWTAGAGITAYQLRIGTTGVGSSNLYASGVISLLEETVMGLPTTGGTVYVRLYYEVAGVWKSADYTYTAA